MSLEFKKIKPGVSGPIYTMDTSSCSSSFVMGQQGDNGHNYNLTEWEVEDFNVKSKLDIDKDDEVEMVLCTRYCCNDRYLVYYKSPRTIYFYDFKEFKHLNYSLNLNESGGVEASKSTSRIVVNASNIEVWDIVTLECLWDSSEYFEGNFNLSSAITDDGKYLVIAGFSNGEVLLYDIENKNVVKRLNNGPDKAWRVFLSSDMKYVSVIGDAGKGVYLWDLKNGESLFTKVFNIKLFCVSLSFLKDNCFVALGTRGGAIFFIDITSGEFKFSLKVHEAKVTDLKATFDGKYLISSSEDGYFGVTKLDTL